MHCNFQRRIQKVKKKQGKCETRNFKKGRGDNSVCTPKELFAVFFLQNISKIANERGRGRGGAMDISHKSVPVFSSLECSIPFRVQTKNYVRKEKSMTLHGMNFFVLPTRVVAEKEYQ